MVKQELRDVERYCKASCALLGCSCWIHVYFSVSSFFLLANAVGPKQDMQVGACCDLTARNSAQTTKSREGWSCKSRGAEMRTRERQFSDRSGTPNQHWLGQPCWRAGCEREFWLLILSHLLNEHLCLGSTWRCDWDKKEVPGDLGTWAPQNLNTWKP